MPSLNEHANNVLGEFQFLPPEHLLSFEMVKRKFTRVRFLEMQKLGLSDTDKTLTSATLDTSNETRDGLLSTGDIYPAFVEIHLNSSSNPESKEKIEIVPLEDLPTFEGSRAIAFYGTPMRYRLSFDAWDQGTITLYFDDIEIIDDLSGTTTVTFPPNFLIFLEKKTKLGLIDDLRLSLAWKMPAEQKEQIPLINSALDALQQSTLVEVAEWQKQFEKWKNKDLNEQPRLRRTNAEILSRGYGNVTRNSPFEY